MSEPTYPTAAIGYRAWDVDADGVLRSLISHPRLALGDTAAIMVNHHTRWSAPVTVAECIVHEAPKHSCACGLYAWHKPPRPRGLVIGLTLERSAVIGAIAARGRLEVHPDGFRAAAAQPLALLRPKRRHIWTRRRVESAARRYRVPIFDSLDELRAYAERFGSPVAAEMIPAPDKECKRSMKARIALPHAVDLLGLSFVLALAAVATGAGIFNTLALAAAVLTVVLIAATWISR